MNRFMSLAVCVLTYALVCVPVQADDPPKKLTPAERKTLEVKWRELQTVAFEAARPEG